jgi:hypothetical protein
MPSLRTLFRAPRISPVTVPEPRTPDVAERAGEAADEGLYLRNPHGMLKMDSATADAYVAAMAG